MHIKYDVPDRTRLHSSGLKKKNRFFNVGNFFPYMLGALVVGFFVQISGKIWIVSGSARNAQVYIWLLLPALIFCLCKVLSWRIGRPNFQYLPWVGFLGWVALTTLWATGSDSDAMSLAKRGLFIFLYLVAINLLLNRGEALFRRALLTGVVVVALGALLSLVWQYGVLSKPIGYRAYRIDRMGVGDIANYGWPVVAGIFNGAVAVWALGLALEKRSDVKGSLFWSAVFVALAVYVVMTGTRGAWFALVGGCLLSVIMHKSKRGILVVGSGLLLMLAGAFFFWDQVVIEVERRQFSGRGAIWDYYFEVMRGHWLVGHGLGTPFSYVWPNGKTISPHAHSLYLQQVYDSGLISLCLMGMGLLGIFYKVWCMRNNRWVKLAFPALGFSMIAMLTDVERIFTRPGEYWTVFWMPIAILLAVSSECKKVQGAVDR